ncbi:hypothetical protein [Flaviflexus equikiangi]|uniref:Transposase, Mutator family n=1 Tax=Flaviflexus equikiangi TaxID=2758573 RepID=A0ABS2TGW6_9ACTO|nr:hypothetical protein [Flaviflexus equikiangi]
MMTETTTSSSSSAVESARLEAVTHLSLSPEEPTELDKAQREAIAQMVRQARDAGIALTGPDGLLRALTAQVVEAALDEQLNEHLGYGQTPRVEEVGNAALGGDRWTSLVHACGGSG